MCKTAIRSETNSCCSSFGLSWCSRRLGSLFVLLPGLKATKAGLETLALKQSLVECGTLMRECHCEAQHGEVFGGN